MAGVQAADLHVAELHDCFTIAEIVALEDLGLCPRGQGGPFSASGATALGGRIPVNPSGGLKSKGHPVGATGAAQLCELVAQLRGAAGAGRLAWPGAEPGRLRRDLCGDGPGGGLDCRTGTGPA